VTATATPSRTATPSASPTSTPALSATPEGGGRVTGGPNLSREGEPIGWTIHLGRPARIILTLYDLTGQRVRRMTLQGLPGPNRMEWDLRNLAGSPVASGLYLYWIEAPGLSREDSLGKVAVIR
jgi:hypothetical protein